MAAWKQRLLRVGIILGGFLIGISLVDPETRASFYEKLSGIILFLGCLGLRIHFALWGPNREDNDREY